MAERNNNLTRFYSDRTELTKKPDESQRDDKEATYQ